MQGGQGLCRESGKCLFGGSGKGQNLGSGIGKKSFWDWENGILEGRESDFFLKKLGIK